jgi:hypothetical protein
MTFDTFKVVPYGSALLVTGQNRPEDAALVAITEDLGQTWALHTVSRFDGSGHFANPRFASDGSRLLVTLLGMDGSVIAGVSNDGGATWNTHTLVYVTRATYGDGEEEHVLPGTVAVSGTLRLGEVLRLPDYVNADPADGDLWREGNDIKVRVGGTTYTLSMTPA